MFSRKISALKLDVLNQKLAVNKAELEQLELEKQLANEQLSNEDYTVQAADLQKRHSELSRNVLVAETLLLEAQNERSALEIKQPWRYVVRRIIEGDSLFYIAIGLMLFNLWLLSA
ncbi:hypothetical protein [Oceanospirillum beijerinckii]|uniref:hypothetical protein n=1 Tax=Oceanospirillum beijerinckii TaxID=64976 RepID=UPI0004096EFE|nr:hypothetical protein [Oceanospirillum beijerinckii]